MNRFTEGLSTILSRRNSRNGLALVIVSLVIVLGLNAVVVARPEWVLWPERVELCLGALGTTVLVALFIACLGAHITFRSED
jgi:hypothetical protein